MALREYSAFNKSAGASILAYACNLTNMDGTLLTGTAPLYFQIHDKASAPASNDVPIKSYEITSSGPFPLASVFQTMGTIPLANGLAVGISTVPNSYTAATATYSVFGEVEEGTQQTDSISGLTTTTATDTAIGVCSAGAPLRLFSLTIVNHEGATVYPLVYRILTAPNDAPSGTVRYGGTSANFWLKPIANGATGTYYFGPEGLLIPANGTTEGGGIWLSLTAPTFTASATAASVFTIKTKV